MLLNPALQVIMPNSWKKVVFLPAYLYKERVSKASSLVLVSCTHFMHTFYPTTPFRHPVQVTILREETLHRMSCQSEVFFVFCLQPRKYGFQDYSAIEEKYHTNYKHIQLRTSYLCTTETTDQVQWIEQLYNEDVS